MLFPPLQVSLIWFKRAAVAPAIISVFQLARGERKRQTHPLPEGRFLKTVHIISIYSPLARISSHGPYPFAREAEICGFYSKRPYTEQNGEIG